MQSPEYLKACNAYITDAKKLLARLGNDTYYDATTTLNKRGTAAGRTPKRLRDAGWAIRDWAYDMKKVDGYADQVGRALIMIGETCAQNAYPMDDHTMSIMNDFFADMAEAKRTFRIED